MPVSRTILLLFFLSYLPALLPAQSIFNMNNAQVSDCNGILLDSEAGQTPGHYDHDEDFTFTICVPGANSIDLDFSSFCVEDGFDFLRIFDGPDTLAPQIGTTYTGTNLPPAISSTTGCLTIHFRSDANVTCTGWVAQWSTTIEEPILPAMTLANQTPSCSTTTVTVNFNAPIPCDSIFPGALSIDGLSGSTVVSAIPINCVNDSTTSAQLSLSPGLTEGGIYGLTYQSFFLDQCDSLWTLTTSDSLFVLDCPLEVHLVADTLTVCEGDCTNLVAEVSGGDFTSYNFTWNPPLPNGPGPHQICPATTTTYTITVSDANGSTPATDTLTITVAPIPLMPANLSLCESDAPTSLVATPPGGWWGGPGIIDNWLGEFHPDSSGPGLHTITYVGPNGCAADMQITVQQIDAGFPEAVCPDEAPFLLDGFIPPGGTWSGPNVAPNGLFTPPDSVDVFTVSYTNNGCTDTKEVYVDFPAITPLDTVCESAEIIALPASPPGGLWSGSGIVSFLSGEFNPSLAGPGLHTLTYSLVGCDTSMDVFVKGIFIGNDFVACPEEAPFLPGTPSPTGGVWSSPFGGIVDSATGLFDPGVNGGTNFIDTIQYEMDGCIARQIAYVLQTEILLQPDTLSFCREDDPILLDWWTVMRTPSNGIWTGPGVIDPDYPGIFDPDAAGPGIHTLVYTANTCSDSMTMVVHPRAIPSDTAVCEGASPFSLPATPPGGLWYGAGVSDSLSGIFDPSVAGLGFHWVYYRSPLGCLDSTEVEVFALPPLSIQNLEPQYCYKDTFYSLIASPPGGTFSGAGMLGNLFNPTRSGAGGPYLIEYTFGEGDCQRSVVGITSVSPPLELSVNIEADTICAGEFLTLSAIASEGIGAPYAYTWDQGLGEGAEHAVSPAQSTTYTVIASDGCSDPVSGQISPGVHPPFRLSFASSEAVCFGENGYAVAQVEGPNVYSYEWNTQPPQTGDTLFAPTGFGYEVLITDLLTGCEQEGTTEIPRFPFVRANFLSNPNDRCQTNIDPTFQFIDQSVGADQGYWDFGDGTIEPYVFGENPSHAYDELGEYEVQLFLSFRGECPDSFSTTVCVIPEESGITVPNAFSPNGDGINDEYFIDAVGIQTLDWKIFDRWGQVVFESDQPDAKWDGRFKGADVPEGVYTYVILGTIIANNPLTNYAPKLFLEKGTITLLR